MCEEDKVIQLAKRVGTLEGTLEYIQKKISLTLKEHNCDLLNLCREIQTAIDIVSKDV